MHPLRSILPAIALLLLAAAPALGQAVQDSAAQLVAPVADSAAASAADTLFSASGALPVAETASPATGPAPTRYPLWIPVLLLVLAAAAAAASLAAARRYEERWAAGGVVAAVALLLATGITGGLWWATRGGAAAGGQAGGWGVLHTILAGLALLTLAFLWMFVAESRRRPIVVESHWGGFGGGLGGVHIPAALLYLATALAFGGMLTVLANSYLDSLRDSGATSEQSVRTAP